MLDLRPQEYYKALKVGDNDRDLFVATHLMSRKPSVIRFLCDVYYLFGGRHVKNADFVDCVDVLRGVIHVRVNGDWIVQYSQYKEYPRGPKYKPSVPWRTFLWR